MAGVANSTRTRRGRRHMCRGPPTGVSPVTQRFHDWLHSLRGLFLLPWIGHLLPRPICSALDKLQGQCWPCAGIGVPGLSYIYTMADMNRVLWGLKAMLRRRPEKNPS